MIIRNILFTTILILLLFSCEKDNDSEPIRNSHRIKQMVQFYNDNETSKTDFTYEGERLEEFTEYNKDTSGNWIEDFKAEISYSGDIVTKKCFDKATDIWILDYKHEYVIQNGLMIEFSTIDYWNGEWIEQSKYIYEYSGNCIVGWQLYRDVNGNGTIELKQKGEYIYQNGKLVEYKYYEDKWDDWYQMKKETFSYLEDNLTSYINYRRDESDNWLENYKYEYIYSGSNVSNKKRFIWIIESNKWESSGSLSFSYDSLGYLIEELDIKGYKTTFEYEEGHGNAMHFWNYPNQSIYRWPTLKSTG